MDNTSSPSPKIWLRAAGQSGINQPDCDCACAVTMPPTSVLDKSVYIQELEIDQSSIIDIDHDALLLGEAMDCKVLLNQSTGDLVVLDSEVNHLLSLLPGTIGRLDRELTKWSSETLKQIVALLQAAHVLSPPHSFSQRRIERKPDTLVAWLHLTEACNMSCVYCYAPRTSRDMKIPTAQRAIEALLRSAQAHGYRRIKVKYAGGEPTLNFSALQAAQQHAETLCLQYGIELDAVLLTNGLSLSRNKLDFILAHDVQIVVSVDGVGVGHDAQRPQDDQEGSSFERISCTLSKLQSWGITPHISVTLTRQNLPYLPDLVDYLLQRDLLFSLNFYRPANGSWSTDPLAFTVDEALESLERAFKVIEDHLPAASLLSTLTDRVRLSVPHVKTCGVGENYMVIGVDGKVYKCQMDLGSGQSPTTIEDENPLIYLRNDKQGIQNLSVENKECRECVWRYYCTGGCPRTSFLENKRYDAESTLCKLYQAIMPLVIRLEALRMLKYEEPFTVGFKP